jgi:hypothetical protein
LIKLSTKTLEERPIKASQENSSFHELLKHDIRGLTTVSRGFYDALRGIEPLVMTSPPLHDGRSEERKRKRVV